MSLFYRYCLCVFGLAALLAWHEWHLQADGTAYVHVLDVGQGDGILIRSPSGKDIVIDGGPDWSELRGLATFMPFFDRSIELLVLTHPDADHVTTFPEALRRYNVKQVLMTGLNKHSPIYVEFLELLAQKKIPVVLPDYQQDIDFGDGLRFDVIWPQTNLFGSDPKDANNTSVTLRALCGNDSMLFTGDIETPTEIAILQSGVKIASNILKAPHHGSHTSSSTGFLLAVHPEMVIVSSGKGNSFGHPHKDVVERYKKLGIFLKNTAQEGVVTVPFCRTMAS